MPGLFDGSGYMMGMHGLGWLGWLGLLVLLVLLVGVFLSGQGRYIDRGGDRRDTPHEVLRRRLASGDITVAEYEERKALLDRDSGRSA